MPILLSLKTPVASKPSTHVPVLAIMPSSSGSAFTLGTGTPLLRGEPRLRLAWKRRSGRCSGTAGIEGGVGIERKKTHYHFGTANDVLGIVVFDSEGAIC